MKRNILILLIALLTGLGSCKKDSEFLNITPTSILNNEQAFSDPAQVVSILANLYTRQADFSSFNSGWTSFADFGESFPSDAGSYGIVQSNQWNYDAWNSYNYGYIRELNLFIQRDSAAKTLSAPDKARFMAEGRFLRANYYFEMAKRMGGVPLILEPLLYDFSGDPTYLQRPRAKESEVYDFVISEAEAIKNLLPATANEKSRATRGAALAMEARAALYAGSIAKYGANTPLVSLPGAEVGIPFSKGNEYYVIALRAAKEIIDGKDGYALYQRKADLAENFAQLFLDKDNTNTESILIEDYKVKTSKVHGFTTNNQPFSSGEESANGDAGRLNPSLNLVESFEKLDNTYAPLPYRDASGNPIYYNNPIDIFAGRDARLAGTVMLPGSSFKGQPLDIWAGYKLADGSVLTNQDASKLVPLPGTTTPVQVLGKDGPYDGNEKRTQSGFYLRKYLDPTPGAGSRGTNSGVAFIRYRYAEVLLNAAEAAFELGQTADAAKYMNMVRARAGLTIPLTAADVTFNKIVHERRVELAFEGHYLFDMKRWRLAHIVWDGQQMTVSDLLSNIGVATKRNTQPYGFWPYKYYNPGNPNNGKWLYDIVLPSKVTGTLRFRLGNYYSQISDAITSANPKIVKQPNQ
ncbi:RagB/SusD family nutrient uptake outer membrane protein [Segetibacter aerophilus]|uniref:Membrane protein n=1 Tax=Segetibacter aerophilus TaxID=670293 RepID=A0A512B754_9BACT|nr:RagB/SusD family nutrient uptake outer membrane protein [Segetibacter aerophilus]GEO07789.1 membrane protein [Segetibacter aerophilus]